MANLVWTGILYACTMGVVLICYRAFMQDRRVEQESGTRAIIDSVYAKGTPKALPINARDKAPKHQIPGVKVQTPPWVKTKRA